MGKPFCPCWVVLFCLGGRKWITSSHSFWFKNEAEEYAAERRNKGQEALVLKDEGDLIATTLRLLNG